MKNFLLTFLLSLFSIVFSNAQSNLWTDVTESQIIQTGERYIIPNVYRTIKLNLSEANSILNEAPMEFTQEAFSGKTIIEIPMPDGTLQLFKFWESPAMAPELQVQYPEIRTYTGQGIDDPYAALKFDLTPHGFHAQILSPNGRVFIDPYSKGNIENYISYYTKDFVKRDAFLECQVEYDEEYDFQFNPESILTPTGPQLRTYRLANAATLEYTNFHGGTVALGLAAVVTSVNRVNGVYEKEAAVRMVLVANNNLIIYTTASGDPYSNSNGSAMLNENQTNLDLVIGSANYDIGHVFSTGGGGIAGLGVVCRAGLKARGVTGQSSPIGDPFDIDYVAHEMGHQFNANHTFNGNAGSCSGNRNASTAYEPGSGSTIMAYAGICSPQNLQSNSDAYFHTISFDEIVAYTNSGLGNGCPVITSTGNNAPVVTVPAGGFAIPKSTPFSLTGSATDPNGDALTYCWEEFDLGPAGAPGSPSGDAAIFRSWNPSTSTTRIFPRLTDLINNTTVIGEILPGYTRNLKFRLTARDNKAGGGGVDRAQVNFTVDGNSGPFVVTSPNTSVSWTGNTSQTITWDVANTTASPVNCANVRILLSTNGGNTFTTELLASTPNDGSQTVTIPNLPTSQARIKVEAVGNIFFDISNVNFTIVNNPGASNPASFVSSAISSSQINLTFTPNGSNNNVVIVWNNTGTFTTPAGVPPSAGSAFAGGTLLYNGISSPQIHSGLASNTNYFYKAFSYDGSTYSSGLTSNATTFTIQNPGTFTAFAGSSTEIFIVFAPNIVNNNVVIIWNNSGTFSTPAGAPPATGQPFAGGTLLYNGITSPQIHSGLTPATNYFYKAFSYDGDNYSSGVNTNATTQSAASTFQLSVSISQGWNIVSIPGLQPTNQHVNTWWAFREQSASVFTFTGGSYVPVDSVEPGRGYYMLHSDNRVYNTGDEWPAGGLLLITHDPISVNSGWNMIGGYENSASVAGLTTTPPGLIVPGTIYGWNGAYYSPTTLEPGYGYWVLLSGAGVINPPTLSKGTTLAKEEDRSKWGTINITDATGKHFTLYSLSEDVNLDHHQMPPIPPTGSFDVRYNSNRRAEYLKDGNQIIEMRGMEYPVSVRIENAELKLQDETGRLLNTVLTSGEETVISNNAINRLLVSENIIPDKYSLEQNYPNPFNPSTQIKFSVSKQTQLKINLYNMLGELVQTITEGLYEPGYYEVKLNAESLVSGIYIYRLESSETVQSKKMLLVK